MGLSCMAFSGRESVFPIDLVSRLRYCPGIVTGSSPALSQEQIPAAVPVSPASDASAYAVKALAKFVGTPPFRSRLARWAKRRVSKSNGLERASLRYPIALNCLSVHLFKITRIGSGLWT